MSALALDLATATGWAVWSAPGEVAYGVWRLPAITHFGIRLDKYRSWLLQAIDQNGVTAVGYELPWIAPHTNQRTAHLLIGMAAHTAQIASERGLICEALNVRQVRKHFIGKNLPRKEAKAATIAQCRAYGFDPQDDNEADAIATLSFFLTKRRVPTGFREIQEAA